MATTWSQVVNAVDAKLKSSLTYATITPFVSASDYLAGMVGQTQIDSKNCVILLCPPDSGAQTDEPMIGGWFRKHFRIEIVVVVKVAPNKLEAQPGKKGIFEIEADIRKVLEHDNLGGLADNKAGSNFEGDWSVIDNDNRALALYSTVYTAVITEK